MSKDWPIDVIYSFFFFRIPLKELGIVKKQLAGIKVLANGKLEKKLTVKANRFSSKAVTKIEEQGGTAEVI